jgi:toxin ParE1/3/4
VPTVEFADEARADIRSINSYTIRNWGTRQARAYVAGLRNFCAELARMPAAGTDASWLAPGLRRFPYESHVIYYRQTPDGIVIIALIHKNQDPERRFQP